jgi:hypothetical protein
VKTIHHESKLKGNLDFANTNQQSAALQTAKEVANQANYRSPVSVLRAFRRGDLRGYRLNARTIRFSPGDVEAWLAAARIEGRAVE